MPKGKREPAGRKPNLPPVQEVRRLPRPTDFNFTSDDVVRPLVEGGWNIEQVLAEALTEVSAVSLFATPLAFNDPRQKLDRDIKAVVANYVADLAKRRGRPVVQPAKFRTRFSKFRIDIAKLLDNFPDPDPDAGADDPAAAALAVDRALIDAVSIKLETQDRPNILDLEQIRDNLSALLEAVDDARADEGGESQRAAHVLLKDLAKVYVERTGAQPSAAPDGHFRRFADAINRQIPENYQVVGLANLIGEAVTAANRRHVSFETPAKAADTGEHA